jgi:hypothetical protein
MHLKFAISILRMAAMKWLSSKTDSREQTLSPRMVISLEIPAGTVPIGAGEALQD